MMRWHIEEPAYNISDRQRHEARILEASSYVFWSQMWVAARLRKNEIWVYVWENEFRYDVLELLP
jgi:hypothetical protein